MGITRNRKQDEGWMKKAMLDLDEEIRKLKKKGLSLRQIANELNVSHMTVRRRLKAMDLTPGTGVTGDVDKGRCNISSKPLPARFPQESRDVEHQHTPSHRVDVAVTPLENPVKPPITGLQKGVSEVSLGFEGLFEAIKGFLEAKGVALYRMHVSQEAYQVKNNGQTIRIYVQRNKEETG
jgi:hypothetical protein